MNRFYKSSFIYGVVPGALKAYDLSDLAATLVPRRLLMAGVTDGNEKSTDIESINKDLVLIRSAYQDKKAIDHLHLVIGEITEKPFALYADWIK